MTIRREGEFTCNYDRGWDLEPEDEATRTAVALLMKEYN